MRRGRKARLDNPPVASAVRPRIGRCARGPVATRQSESVREGWEDYRLLTLLKQRGMNETVAAVLHGYAEGESLEVLRARALRAAAEQTGH